jgi:diguanylate cyclase (GGDEF)-like protein/PAS domain S-box-containing protein
MLYDISGRKQTEQALAASEERWKFALEGAGEGVWDWNMLTGAALFSRRWKEMLGYSNEEIGDRADEWSSRVHPEDLPGVMATIQDHLDGRTPSATAEFRMRCRDGSWRWTLGRGMLVSRDDAGRPMRLVGTNADITERKLMEEQLHVLAFYDNLTRLPNRRLLGNRLSQLQAASRRTGCYGALMFLDLDHFKLLNDSHGHTVGDRLLTEAAERLKGCIRAADTAARFGGDEFVLLLGGLAADRQQAEALAEVIAAKAQARLAEPYQLAVSRADGSSATITHRCTVSIGVALFSGLEAREDDLLRLADRAMYQAKQSGRGAVRFA